LAGREADAREYIHSLEEIAIRTAQDFGIQAFRRSGMPGVWTAQGKIAALGVRFKRWVSSHGLSFNIDLDLTGYAAIIPCGLSQESVTSLQALLGDRSLRLAAVRRCLIRHFQQVFRRKLKPFYIGRDPLPAAVKESMEGACRTA
jgi:lipoate-protein ligase B